MGIKKSHSTHRNIEYKAIHICKVIRTKDNQGTKILHLDLGENSGWYFVDLGVKLQGDGGVYGTAIYYCPYCGEKL